MKEIEKYQDNYSDEAFWDKVKKYGKAIGKETIEKAFILFYALKDPDTPPWAKGIILGTLGYLILPADLIPDVIPVTGFSDDAANIAIAFLTIAGSIKEEHKEKAREQVNKIFGE